MRIPNINSIKKKDFDDSDYELRRIKNYYAPDEISYDISEAKSRENFVKYIKTLVRQSYEYKQMIAFLRKNIDMTHCSYFKKVNNQIKGITIEIHHDPFTIEDIIYIVLKSFLDNGMDIRPAVIAEQVMLLHYQGLIGLIPLSKTVHELVGAKKIFVPIYNVYGDIESFYKQYHEYMSEDQKSVLAKSIRLSEQLAKNEPSVLKKKFIYFDIDGMEFPKYIKKKK